MAPRDSLPGFLFNVQKWRGSRSAQRMSFSQRGVYLEMMFEQWEKRFLADDAQAVAEAIATTPEQIAEVIAAWPIVRPKFATAERGTKRIYNVALERTRREQRANLEKKREAGKIAGKASAAKRQKLQTIVVNDRSTTVQRPSTEKLDQIDQIEKRREEGAVNGRSKRPVFQGQRFVVFDWQLENLMRILGPLIERFDLHEWFFDLDTQMLQSAEVVPQRDGGKWLEARLMAEAHRRGLPIAQAPHMGKLSSRMAAMVANAKVGPQ